MVDAFIDLFCACDCFVSVDLVCVKASPVTTYTWSAVHLAAADDVFDSVGFCVNFPHKVPRNGYGIELCQFLGVLLLTFTLRPVPYLLKKKQYSISNNLNGSLTPNA